MTTTSTANARRDFIAGILADFPTFLHAVWDDRGLSDPSKAPLGELELDIARFGAGIDTAASRRVILAFRGVGKTHLITAGLACYRALRDPDRKIIIVSKSLDAAKKTVRLIRQWLDQVWFLRHLAPLDGQRDAATYLDFGPAREDRQPSITAIGIGGPLENNRAHTIIGDDVETKANTKTADAREHLQTMVCEFSNILYPDRPGLPDPTEIVHVGTVKHADTLFIKLQQRGYETRGYPIQLPGPAEPTIALAPILQARIAAGQPAGTPTCHHRFGPEEIAKRLAEGEEEFAREFMLIADPGAGDTYPLKLADLIVYPMSRDVAPVGIRHGTVTAQGSTRLDIRTDGFGHDRLHGPAHIDPTLAPYTGTIAWIDPAGRGSDRTGIAIGSALCGLIFTKLVASIPGGSSTDDIDRLIAACRTHGARSIYIESTADTLGAYRQLFESRLPRAFVRPGHDPNLPDGWQAGIIDDSKITHSTQQKEERIIATLRPILQNHRLVIHPRCLIPKDGEDRTHTLQYQLTHVRRERKCLAEDAELDALTGLCRAWTYILRSDPDKAAQRLTTPAQPRRFQSPRTAGFLPKARPERWNASRR